MYNLWCEINNETFNNNIKKIETIIENKRIIAVLKANAYGFGVSEIASMLPQTITTVAVSNIPEALAVPNSMDVLVLGPTSNIDDFKHSVGNQNIIHTICNNNMLAKIDKEHNYRVHIMVDTLNRKIGVSQSNLKQLIEQISTDYPNIHVEGIYTHFHEYNNESLTLQQMNDFRNSLTGIDTSSMLIHCISSSGLDNKKILQQADFTNAVRVGNALYGYSSCSEKIGTFYAKILQKYTVNAGEYIGLGSSYVKANAPTTIGVLNCGNFEGVGTVRSKSSSLIKDIARPIRDVLSSSSPVIISNKPINVIGKSNMNTLLLDISNCPTLDIVEVSISSILADSSIKKEIV